MILTFVNGGTSGPEGINYLFSEKDANGKLRNPPAELLSGDVLLTKYLIRNNQREKKYSSYALSFRDNEKVTDDQLKEILQSLRDTFCTGLGPDRVNMLAVKHTDKNNIEVHIVINDEELTTGRQFNPWPPGARSKKLQQDFCAYWNHKLGFEQVVGNPFKASFSRFDAKAPAQRIEQSLASIGNAEASATKERKEKLSAIVTKAVMSGKISNRNELISFLENNECKVTRKGTDYLSVRLPGKEKSIRFRGGCFLENVDYRILIAEHNTASRQLAPYQFKKIKDNLNNAMDYKRELHARIYTPRKKRIPKLKSEKVAGFPKVKMSSNHNSELKAKLNTQPNANHSDKSQSPSKSKPTEGSSATVSSGNSNENLLISIGSMENKIFALGIKLSLVSIEQRAQIQSQIEALKIQVMRMHLQLAEAKKVELNKVRLNIAKFR